jgi:hypothetical protein
MSERERERERERLKIKIPGHSGLTLSGRNFYQRRVFVSVDSFLVKIVTS